MSLGRRGKPEDTCWEEVEREFTPGKMHPKVSCKFCNNSWTSKDKRRVADHMRGCSNLPERLWPQFQPEKAGLPPLPPSQRSQPRQHQQQTQEQNLELWATEPPWMWTARPSSANNNAETPTNDGLVDYQTHGMLSTPNNKRKRESPDTEAALKRLAGRGKGSQFWRHDTDLVVDGYLSAPSATELAPLRRVISQLGREAQYADDAMSSIRYAWHTKLAEGLGEMITFEADAVRVVANLLRVAEERQLKGFGRRVLRQAEAYLPAEGEPEGPE
ncbi:hypothetical protein LTR36_008504 [Oleoguttula mirabilis]|uniref:BED-type domain-containing protein n=1 Tax=Oleoguttula mirabilis TaxID=1507867 RepID=A0AAV9JSR1_9PEZI|nr:hypothetical protein LTR36_008504 [Oleoguttula mirabilis]